MARSKSSNRWLQEHFSDQYVSQSRRDGLRSRACYKLLELNKRDRLIKQGNLVIDLGAAPGGWSQVAADLVGDSGKVIASDILPMDSIPGVQFLQGDFTEAEVYDQLLTLLDGRAVDIVISDMAPNISGVADIDIPRAMHLVELALDLARNTLKPKGNFVAKVFQGEGFEAYVRELKDSFGSVVIRKPASSRARSREVYTVARSFRSR